MVGAFAKERYISLTTFKRDGTPISTPVWVATDDGRRLLVLSGVKTWKVRRLRRDPNHLVAASNYRGKERGGRLPARARLIPDPGIDRSAAKSTGGRSERSIDSTASRRQRPGLGSRSSASRTKPRGTRDDLRHRAAWTRS